MKYQIGQTVNFRFGKIAATEEGRHLDGRRARNMHEMAHHNATAYKGEYIDQWVCTTVIGYNGDKYVVGDSRYPDEAYCFVKESDLKAVS